MEGAWQIELLGCLRATQGDQSVTRFQTHKTAALLAYLSYYLHRSHPREALIELLWPDCDPNAGRLRLRVALSSLRRQLEPPGVPPGAVIVANRVSVQLNAATVTTDVRAFEAALQAASRTGGDTERAQRLIETVQFYRGELLPGFFEEWIPPERERLSEAYVQTLHLLVACLEQTGDLLGALRWARHAVSAAPLQEEGQYELIRLLVASGNREAALRQYQELERLLKHEFDAAPAAKTRALVEQLLAIRGQKRALGDPPALAVSHLANSPSADSCPTLLEPPPGAPTSGAPVTRVGHLPLQVTRFFGRAAEIAHLQEMLLAGETRLLTLTGPGGSGKTRLALEVARTLCEPFRNAVWFASLVDLSDPGLIPDQVLKSLRLSRSPELDPLDQVVSFLSRQPALLVLDNFEHLAPQGVVLLQTLVERVETLTVLVTSRKRLALPGEREVRLSPLPVPDVQVFSLSGRNDVPAAVTERLTQCPSVQLFVDRARAVRPDFQVTRSNAAVVATLCRRLDGLPLALELAATRAGVLTPTQMLSRLEQRLDLLASRQRQPDPRHASLRAALDWSYQLLTPELQRFFLRLSVFRGGCTLEAAEAVCEEPLALDYLQQLHESSLVFAEEQVGEQLTVSAQEFDEIGLTSSTVQTGQPISQMRFRLLDTLREYGSDQLAPQERHDLAQHHADYYLALAEEAEPKLESAERGVWMERLEQEHDNLRVALTWSQTEPQGSDAGLRLAGALQWFWDFCGHLSEGRGWLEDALVRASSSGPTPARAKALFGAGTLALLQGDLAAGQARLEESIAIWQQIGDRRGLARSQTHLTWVVPEENVTSLLENSIILQREVGDQWGLAQSLRYLGLRSLDEGHHDRARCLMEQSLAIARAVGDPWPIAWALRNLGEAAHRQGDWALARTYYEQSLAIHRALGHDLSIALSLQALGDVILEQGDTEAARPLYEDSLAITQRHGARGGIACSLWRLGRVARFQGDWQMAQSFFEQSLAIERERDDRRGTASMLKELGIVSLHQADYHRARSLLEQSLLLFREQGNKHGIAECLEALVGVAVEVRTERRETADKTGAGILGNRAPVSVRLPACLSLEQAARLLGAAHALRQWPLTPVQQPEHKMLLVPLQKALGQPAFTDAWVSGSGLTAEHAAALGLGELSADDCAPGQQPPPPDAEVCPEPQQLIPRGDLTTQEWERIAPLLPTAAGRRGRPYQDHRRVINGIFWIQRTGAAWRDLPSRYGPWTTCNARFVRWRRQGLWSQLVQVLERESSSG